MTGELILVVEDDADSRMLVRDVLAFNGYRVLEADRAEVALVLARRDRPALVLMDIRLPGMDGFAALAALRSDPSLCAIPVIALTASSMNHDRARIERAGFDGYHGKPIDIAGLSAVIRATLTRGDGAGRQ